MKLTSIQRVTIKDNKNGSRKAKEILMRKKLLQSNNSNNSQRKTAKSI